MTFHGLCEHLKLITQNELICYTELELIYLMIDRVNEVIESLNTLESDVDESIKKYLIEMKQNGELEELINEALFEALDHKIDLMGNVPVDDDLQKLLDAVDVANFPAKTYLITKPLVVRRGKSIKGNHCKIVADFSQWQGGDYTAIKVEIDDPASSSDYVLEHMERVIQDLIIEGRGNNAVLSTGIKLSTSVSISTAEAVNYSYSGTMKDIVIRCFDTALDIQSSWQTVFQNIKCLQCRRGIIVNGKVVNNRFIGCDVTNPSKNYTASTEKTYGIVIKPNAELYTEGNGNPEGNMFYGCTLFQNDYNITIEKAYFTTFTDCIIDGCQYQSITLDAPNELNFNSCYIAQYKKGTGRMVDHSYPEGDVYPSRVCFRDCTLQGLDTEEDRGDCFVFNQNADEALVRFNVIGCNILAFNRVFNLNGCLLVSDSLITGNKCYNIHTGFIGNWGGGGGRTLIDNNRVHANVPFLELPVPNRDNHLHIGRNYCWEQSATFFIGKVVVPSGSSTVDLPNGLATADTGCIYKNDIQFLTSRPGVSYNVVDNYSHSDGRIFFNGTTTEQCTVIYTVSMVMVK